MRDDRRIFIPDPDPKSDDGYWKLAAWLFCGVMTVALLDRGATLAWQTAAGWYERVVAAIF